MRLASLLVFLLLANLMVASAQLQAAVIPVAIDLVSGARIGGGGNNPNNGGVFGTGSNNPPEIGGVTTSIVSRTAGNGTPGTATYRVEDSNNGVDFTFDVIYEGFVSDAAGNTTGGIRARLAGGHFAVDSTLPGETRGTIDSAAKLGLPGGDFEFGRLILTNIVASSQHTVATTGFNTIYMKLANQAGDAGEVRVAGTTTVLGSYSTPFSSINSGPVPLTPSALAIDYVPTGDGASIQGFAVTFDANEISNVIPEPSTYLVFCGLALCFGIAGWWRKRRKSV